VQYGLYPNEGVVKQNNIPIIYYNCRLFLELKIMIHVQVYLQLIIYLWVEIHYVPMLYNYCVHPTTI